MDTHRLFVVQKVRGTHIALPHRRPYSIIYGSHLGVYIECCLGCSKDLGGIDAPAKINLAFHPPDVGKSSIGLWLELRRSAFTCVGWQLALCDPIWQVTLCSYVINFLYGTFIFTFSAIFLRICKITKITKLISIGPKWAGKFTYSHVGL